MPKTTPFTIALILASAALAGCAAGGINEDTPLRAVGPKAEGSGVFSGKDGVFTGTIGDIKTFKTEAEQEAEAEQAEATGANDADYQEWKKSREKEEYEAWKRQQSTQ